MRDRPLIAAILDSIARYRRDDLDLDGLQRNLAAVATALEGDVPKSIRTEVEDAESSLEMIRFSSRDPSEVERVLR